MTQFAMRLTDRPAARLGWIGGITAASVLVAWLLAPKFDYLPVAQTDVVEDANAGQQRTVSVLQVDEDIATVRLESPWFIDHLQMGRFDGRWVIVNALWHRKPRPRS